MNAAYHGFRRIVRGTRMASNIVWNDVRVNLLGQRYPLKPNSLNLLVNDICNSRCQMCSIWEKKRDHELTPSELAQILNDPLFDKLRYVGVSGGEPTLRHDLPDIFRVLVAKEPRLRGTGIITNAIRADDVISKVTLVSDICRKAGVSFRVMVSLDGVEAIHDRVRGREGNFANALEVIRHFRDQTDIPVLFGCTITKDNVWHVDDLLEFAQKENLYGRFRVAEFIQRLYNEGQHQYIRNFSPIESYHLALFFTRLERTFEQNHSYRRTYSNIRAMLLQGAKRTIKCPYQAKDVVIDCRGQMLYCAPKSPVLGNSLNVSAEHLYKDNIEKRKRILAEKCHDCIHDYHAMGSWQKLLDTQSTGGSAILVA